MLHNFDIIIYTNQVGRNRSDLAGTRTQTLQRTGYSKTAPQTSRPASTSKSRLLGTLYTDYDFINFLVVFRNLCILHYCIHTLVIVLNENSDFGTISNKYCLLIIENLLWL